MRSFKEIAADIITCLPELEALDQRSDDQKQRSLEAGKIWCQQKGRPFIEHGGFVIVEHSISTRHDSMRALPDLTRLCTPSNFDCSQSRLESLQGSPAFVGSSVDCSNNYLIDLVGAPLMVVDAFNCTSNPLLNLRGVPTRLERLIFTSREGVMLDIDQSTLSMLAEAVPNSPVRPTFQPAPWMVRAEPA